MYVLRALLSEIEHEVDSQSFIARLDAYVARLAVRALLFNRLERLYGRDVEQEGYVAFGEGGHGAPASCASFGFLRGEDAVEDSVAAGVDGERRGVALDGCPVHVGVVALELRIYEIVVALAGYGVVVILVPDVVVGAGNAVLP